MPEIKKADLKSMDIPENKLRQLKQAFPEAFTEGLKVDLDKLRLSLGENADAGRERFGMNWPGKADCFKIIQAPSVATLIPARDESINFDTTENLFIEGDNLEVLKLLQKSYYGKIKMIYIDPPYNTGSDFIYPDNYAESLDTYLRYSGQIDDQGRKYSTNVETDGRFHSKWLNMMYPRLYLAKNLLKDDGVIFISINDKEQSNLKFLCNDIFGEENFLAQLIWDKNHSAQAGVFKVYHEYVLVYAKNQELIRPPQSLDNEEFDAGAMKKESDRHPMQKFRFPKGTRFDALHGTELKGEWGETEKVILHEGRMISENGKLKEDVVLEAAFTQANQMKQFFYGNKELLLDSRGQKVIEFYFTATGKLKIKKERGVFTPPTVGRWGTQGDISVSLASLFGMSSAPLETPKSPAMIREFIEWFCEDADIIIDFFAGSCATAQSTIESRLDVKFIMTQLPELCDKDTEAYKSGFKTIAEIGKERIRRVIKMALKEDTKKETSLFDENHNSRIHNLGFKVFKLAQSNFKVWEGSVDPNKEVVERQLEMHVEHISLKSSQEDLLFELLLKAGFELTTKIEKVLMVDKMVYSIEGGLMLVCLEKELTKEVIKAMAEKCPSRVICLDEGFAGNDQLKTNAVQTMKSKGVEDFRTV